MNVFCECSGARIIKTILGNDFVLVRVLYLRLLALVYSIAFLSVFVQIHSLWSHALASSLSR
jgi:hypothetical protein